MAAVRNEIFSFDKEKFRNVSDLKMGVIYSWIWNSEITKEYIDEELLTMKKQGIKGVYILPEPKEFRPDSMATRLKPDYLTDEFFELVEYAVSTAEKLHIFVWLYDEGGWPSGSACGRIVKKYPDTTAKYIKEESVLLKKGETANENDKLAVFTKDFKRLSLPYTAENDIEVYVYSERFHDTIYTYVLDDRVMDEFIESTYEGYKKHLGGYFGNYVSAIFSDEPNLSFPYCIDIQDFENKSGYNFKDNLPAIFHNGISKKADAFKTYYIEYAAKQFEEKYMKRLRKWCTDNDILFTGHMSGEDILENFWHCIGNPMKHLRHFDIPGIDAIWRQIFPTNTKNNFFPRLASSAAHQTGGNFAVSESFAAYGSGVTFDEMRYVANYQFVRGINIINIMSITSGKDRFLFGQLRPHFVKKLPAAEYMKEFNDYITRMMYICSIGNYTAETAIYMPVRDVWIGSSHAEIRYNKMGKELEEKQIYFDIIDDDFLAECKICDNCLCMGNAKYKYIYIPQSDNMSKEGIRKLEGFIKEGGNVFGNVGNIKGIKAYSGECILAESVIKSDNKNLRAMKKKSENETVYVIYNESPHEVFATIEIPEENAGCYLNAQNGEIEKLESNTISIDLVSGEAYVVVYKNELFWERIKKEETAELFMEINEFEIIPKEKLLICEDKLEIYNKKIYIDKSFSGSAIYRCEFEYKDNGNLLLEFDELYYYAKVFVNENEIGTVIMSPKKLLIDKKYLKEKNILSIVVTNTAANAFYYADLSQIDKKYIGSYNEKTISFEKDSLKFGLSKIRLYKGI